ncbi:MAG: hypothetical protein HYT16_01510 [DPANN group archaeon]|nr:hypothetical protein [DPANN group archaeon]
MINPTDLIAGAIIIIAGLVTIAGMANLGVVLAGIGLLVEAIKIIIKLGL